MRKIIIREVLLLFAVGCLFASAYALSSVPVLVKARNFVETKAEVLASWYDENYDGCYHAKVLYVIDRRYCMNEDVVYISEPAGSSVNVYVNPEDKFDVVSETQLNVSKRLAMWSVIIPFITVLFELPIALIRNHCLKRR